MRCPSPLPLLLPALLLNAAAAAAAAAAIWPPQTEALLGRLEALTERIDDTEDFVNIDLDNRWGR